MGPNKARFHLNLRGVRTFDPCGRLIITSISGGEYPHLKVDLDLAASPKEPSLNRLRRRRLVLKTPWLINPLRVVCSFPNYRQRSRPLLTELCGFLLSDILMWRNAYQRDISEASLSTTSIHPIRCRQLLYLLLIAALPSQATGDPWGSRNPVQRMKISCPRPLDEGAIFILLPHFLS